jgi:O-methyltransferase
VNLRDIVRAGGQRAQTWLRTNRRLERLLHRFTKLESEQTRYSHELIVPMNSTYSPWHDDAEFRATYDAIAGHTFVDAYKCWELWEQLGQLGHVDGDILEVGVWRGGTGTLLARRSAACGFDADVYLADTFAGVAHAGVKDPWYRGGEHADTSPAIVSALARRSGVAPHLLVGIFPDDTGHHVADCTFRLIHIDVDVYESARRVLVWAWPKLSVGGVVVWDDYGSFQCEGVVTLGRTLFEMASSAFHLIHNLNGHLLLIKLRDEPIDLVGGDIAEAV